MKNILIADSSPSLDPVMAEVFEKLYFSGWSLFFWSSKDALDGPFLEKLNGSRKKFFFGPRLGSGTKNFLFLILLPFLRFLFLLRLYLHSRERPLKSLIVFGLREKLILSPAARWLGIQLVFAELPGHNFLKLSRMPFYKSFLKRYLKSSRLARVVSFSSAGRTDLLRAGVKDEMIRIVVPGIKSSAEDQTSLFQTLADKSNFHRKFFTVGTVVDLDKKQKTEILFQAIKECSSAIPNLQLVIIGDGKERKNLSWIAKKLKIDNQVWFISPGGQPGPGAEPAGQAGEKINFPKKWLDSFELYISVCEEPVLTDFSYVLKAMANGVPVIAPAGLGFEDIIIQNKTGCVIEMDLSEMLARQLIKLFQNLNLRAQLGQNARALVDRDFNLDKMAENFIKALN
ncbi:MAG: glycosyltransferase family 4 protein [Patescibacteria group bacterium]|jgi:glycosyltransferase involved in cell wall biosynthesis